MRILLVGNTSLQNNAITKILLSQDGWEVSQMYPSTIIEEKLPFGEHHFLLSLIDLCSLAQNVESYIEDIRNLNLATYLVVMHDDHPDYLLQKLVKKGVDACLSVNSKTEQFVQAISQFHNF